MYCNSFEIVINKAKESCKNSDISVFDHFVDVDKMVQIGSGADGIVFLERVKEHNGEVI